MATIFWSTVIFASDSLAPFYRIIKAKPQIQLSLRNGNIEVVNIYKRQVLSVHESRGTSEEERISQYVKDVYLPHQEFWNNFFFNDSGFGKWTRKNWAKLQSVSAPGFVIPFVIDFDSLFVATTERMKVLTSREPQGKWFLVYGNKASNIGGFANGDMFVDFFGLGNKGSADLVFSLPHEINHQIFSTSRGDGNTLLYTILDEGFACYVNYLYWEKKESPARNIDFTDAEWTWCIEHEKEIFDFARPLLDSTDREINGTFQKAHRHIFDGVPDRIAYFIGFRICEAYVARFGSASWKDIFTKTPGEILTLSGYLQGR